METLSEIISRLPRAKEIKGPSPEELKPNNREAGLLRILEEWHEESKKTPYLLGVPQEYQ